MKILCVIVIYEPNYKILKKNIQILKNQVNKILLVNNGKKIANIESSKIEQIYFNANLGIATAQNIGVDYAEKHRFDFCMFSDQDTYFQKNYISEAQKIYKKFYPKNKIFALCPNLFDRNKKKLSGFTGRRGFFKKNYNYEIKNLSESAPNFIKITEAMSSGMIINLKILKKICYYREDFFLDWIDFEICWRAVKNGYYILGLPKIIGSHFLGKYNIKILGNIYHVHEVFRIYYIIRNGIYISFYNKIFTLWKINILLNTLRYSLGYIIFMRPKILVIKFILLGIYHGIFKKLGRMGT